MPGLQSGNQPFIAGAFSRGPRRGKVWTKCSLSDSVRMSDFIRRMTGKTSATRFDCEIGFFEHSGQMGLHRIDRDCHVGRSISQSRVFVDELREVDPRVRQAIKDSDKVNLPLPKFFSSDARRIATRSSLSQLGYRSRSFPALMVRPPSNGSARSKNGTSSSPSDGSRQHRLPWSLHQAEDPNLE